MRVGRWSTPTERNLLCMYKYQCLRLAGQLTDSRRLAYAVFYVYL